MGLRIVLALAGTLILFTCTKKTPPSELAESTGVPVKEYAEKYRPQLHFSPPAHWMNDPNGLVYLDGEYHLFYQYYPEDIIWGPMHWGHAVTKDLVHWINLPIALAPDSLGMIFSGSAVVDKTNTSGFGSAENPPMVAMFTYHNASREKLGTDDHETQGLAYSIDKGRTWTKYEHNPVIGNHGMKDFRDPKMFWHEASKQWIVTIVAGDHAQFHGSKDLKSWKKLGEFGQGYGSHDGVWECPDLFPLTIAGEKKQKWILIVNINPGGPNGGSGTQYFIGDFDGKKFTTDQKKTKVSWIDYGPDNYAGITWSGAPNGRTLLIGWMSNWSYAQQVPTSTWRSANTVARELKLVRLNGELVVASEVVPELETAGSLGKVISKSVTDSLEIVNDFSTGIIKGSIEAKDWEIKLSNQKHERVVIGFEALKNRFYIDRSASGDTNFSKVFAVRSYAPRISKSKSISFSMVVDVSSVEIFFDEGVTVMTSIFFPDTVMSKVSLVPKASPLQADSISVEMISSIW
ncbi:MAG: glycoside hydrolase family 32 protein [Chryseolinea sp.]